MAPVAFDCETGPREIVRNGIDGVLVSPAGDSEALAAHLSDMMAHPEQSEAYARRAVDVRDRFSTSRIMALWGYLFEVPLRAPAYEKGKAAVRKRVGK